MTKYSINPYIFPRVMTIHIDSPTPNSIDLPKGANLLYLQALSDPDEKYLFRKYANKEHFSDEDYLKLFHLFLTDTPRISQPLSNPSSWLQHFGIQLFTVEDQTKFSLLEDAIPQIRVDTWDYIAVDLLKPLYTDIINLFDFGDTSIYLGAWKSESDVQKQSLLTAFRSSLMFTLIGFMFGDDRTLYSSFNDYFEHEFYKRIALVNALWKNKREGEIISYLPIFDSFYNLRGNTSDNLIHILHAILGDTTIAKDERQMIYNRLIEGAEEIHSDTSALATELEISLIKPVVNLIYEITTSKENLDAARQLHEAHSYNIAISRCYYSMMHAVKALLESNELLDNWEPDQLNVSASHRFLEQQLENLVVDQHIFADTFLDNFKYVKQKRWIADYTVCHLDIEDSSSCIQKASTFLSQIESLI
ncbi:MAG: HEPN domain-containing protein [Anaerobutyricum soehngenii]